MLYTASFDEKSSKFVVVGTAFSKVYNYKIYSMCMHILLYQTKENFYLTVRTFELDRYKATIRPFVQWYTYGAKFHTTKLITDLQNCCSNQLHHGDSIAYLSLSFIKR